MPIAAIFGPDDLANPSQRETTGTLASRELSALRGPALPRPSLEWNEEVERATEHLYSRIIIRHRKSSIASPTSPATRSSSPSKPPR